MELTLTYYGKVSDTIKIYRANEMHNMVVRNFAGKEIEITIRRKRKRRSLMQNAYYFGVVLPVVCQGLNDAGYRVGKEEVHEFLKSMFNKKELINHATGEVLPTIGSTATMTTVEMMAYFEDISRWAAEFLGVVIPAPGQQIELL